MRLRLENPSVMTAKKKTRKKRTTKKTKTQKPKLTRYYNFKVGSGFGDFLEIQVSAKLKRVPVGVKITRAMIQEMIRDKALDSSGQWNGVRVVGAREGRNPPGIELTIIRWRNANRKKTSSGWRSGDQADAWGSLRRPIAEV